MPRQPPQTRCCLPTASVAWGEQRLRKRTERRGQPWKGEHQQTVAAAGQLRTRAREAMQMQLSAADGCCDELWDVATPAPLGLPGAGSAFPEQDGVRQRSGVRQHGHSSSGRKPSALASPCAECCAETLRSTTLSQLCIFRFKFLTVYHGEITGDSSQGKFHLVA